MSKPGKNRIHIRTDNIRIGMASFSLEFSPVRGYHFSMKSMPHREFLELVRKGDPVRIQNRLQTASDKELYLALRYLTEPEHEEVFRRLSGEKAVRIRDIFKRGIRFGQEEYRTGVGHLLLHLSADIPPPPLRSWYRPGKTGKKE